MRAGKLRHRVQIQRRVLSEPTATGQRDVTWPRVADVWSEVRTLSGRELEMARGVHATVSHTVRIRYLADVVPTWRVLWGRRVLAINSAVDEENRKREMVLYCTEEVR